MSETVAHAATAVDLILKSMFWSPPLDADAMMADGDFHVVSLLHGAEVHYEGRALLDAALFIRRNGSPHLHSLSIEDLQQMLITFIGEEMTLFRFDWWRLSNDRPLSDHVSLEGKAELAGAMLRSPIFAAPDILFLFPISVMTIEAPFRSQSFFLLPPDALSAELRRRYPAQELKPGHHPPVPMHAGMPLTEIACWLGVRSPVVAMALRTWNVIMGACALLPHPLERYSFSTRSVAKGLMSFDKRATYHSGDASSPPLNENLYVSAADHDWLTQLAHKLGSDAAHDRKAMLSLQYFYRAWVGDPATRVAPLCGVLDALFGNPDTATQAMIDAVGAARSLI